MIILNRGIFLTQNPIHNGEKRRKQKFSLKKLNFTDKVSYPMTIFVVLDYKLVHTVQDSR